MSGPDGGDTTPVLTTVFQKYPMTERIVLDSRYLNRNVGKSIENRLRNTLEGVCSRHGFIRPASISVSRFGDGRVSTENGGKTSFRVDFQACVCNPSIGSVIPCRVEAIAGIAAFAVNATDDVRVVEVMIPPSPKAYQHEVPFSDVKVGDVVAIRLVAKRFHLGQKTMVCAGQLVPMDSASSVAFSTDAPAVPETARVTDSVKEERSLRSSGPPPGSISEDPGINSKDGTDVGQIQNKTRSDENEIENESDDDDDAQEDAVDDDADAEDHEDSDTANADYDAEEEQSLIEEEEDEEDEDA